MAVAFGADRLNKAPHALVDEAQTCNRWRRKPVSTSINLWTTPVQAIIKFVLRTGAVGALVLLSACSGLSVLNAISPHGGYGSLQNIRYGAADESLDVYTPAHPVDAPVVVFLYGGSWQTKISYPKANYRFLGEALAARGYVTVIPDYRLYPAVRYPDFLDDCARAVVWAHAHARAYGGDPNRIVVMGHSAGAYNAAMLALDPGYMQQAGGERNWIKAMIGLAGPYDFLPLDDADLEQVFAPAKPLETSQPINHVDGHNPPMLLMAGENDSVVYAKNSRNLYARIKAAGGPVEEVIFPEMSHAKIIATTATRLQFDSDVMPHIVDFVQRSVGTTTQAQR